MTDVYLAEVCETNRNTTVDEDFATISTAISEHPQSLRHTIPELVTLLVLYLYIISLCIISLIYDINIYQ